MSKLNAIKLRVNWRILLVLTAIAWLVNTATGAISESVELSGLERAGVLVAGQVSSIAFAILALFDYQACGIFPFAHLDFHVPVTGCP